MVDEISREYGKTLRLRALGLLDEMEQVSYLRSKLQELAINPLNIIDIGCGSGHFFRMISEVKSNSSYTGVDINAKYLSVAREAYHGKNVKFIKANSNNLSMIADQTFDVSICYMLIPFLRSFKATLQECMRITKSHLFLRLLISDHTYLIQRRLPNNINLYYNIYSESEFMASCIEFGAKKVEFFEEKTHLKIPKKNSLDTYIENGVQISGQIILPWKYVSIEK